jgi:hypothetical protein
MYGFAIGWICAFFSSNNDICVLAVFDLDTTDDLLDD